MDFFAKVYPERKCRTVHSQHSKHSSLSFRTWAITEGEVVTNSQLIEELFIFHHHPMQVLHAAVVAISFHDVRPASQGVHVVTATWKEKNKLHLLLLLFLLRCTCVSVQLLYSCREREREREKETNRQTDRLTKTEIERGEKKKKRSNQLLLVFAVQL